MEYWKINRNWISEPDCDDIKQLDEAIADSIKEIEELETDITLKVLNLHILKDHLGYLNDVKDYLVKVVHPPVQQENEEVNIDG